MLRSSFSTLMSLCLSVSGAVAISFFPSVKFWLMERDGRSQIKGALYLRGEDGDPASLRAVEPGDEPEGAA